MTTHIVCRFSSVFRSRCSGSDAGSHSRTPAQRRRRRRRRRSASPSDAANDGKRGDARTHSRCPPSTVGGERTRSFPYSASSSSSRRPSRPHALTSHAANSMSSTSTSSSSRVGHSRHKRHFSRHKRSSTMSFPSNHAVPSMCSSGPSSPTSPIASPKAPPLSRTHIATSNSTQDTRPDLVSARSRLDRLSQSTVTGGRRHTMSHSSSRPVHPKRRRRHIGRSMSDAGVASDDIFERVLHTMSSTDKSLRPSSKVCVYIILCSCA